MTDVAPSLLTDGAAGQALHQGRPALPAVERPAAVGGRAVRAAAGHAVLLHAQQALDLRQLGVALLQHRRAAHEHVEAEVVADRHLVGETPEVPVQLGHLLGERVAPAAQVRAPVVPRRAAAGAEVALASWRSRRGRSPAGCAAAGSACPAERVAEDAHAPSPVSTTSGRFLDFSS